METKGKDSLPGSQARVWLPTAPSTATPHPLGASLRKEVKVHKVPRPSTM